jgi:hypothetical protein
VKVAPAIVCAALLVSQAACTFGPASSDGGTTTTTTTTTTTRSLGDQCESVLSVFCQQAASCALLADLNECITGNEPMCCIGSACTATSTVSEDDVTSCEQMIMAEQCYAISITMDPTACLTSM